MTDLAMTAVRGVGRVWSSILDEIWQAKVAARAALAVSAFGADQLAEAEAETEVAEPGEMCPVCPHWLHAGRDCTACKCESFTVESFRPGDTPMDDLAVQRFLRDEADIDRMAAEHGWGEQPVDSATRRCCGGIGGHARHCPTFLASVASPPGVADGPEPTPSPQVPVGSGPLTPPAASGSRRGMTPGGGETPTSPAAGHSTSDLLTAAANQLAVWLDLIDFSTHDRERSAYLHELIPELRARAGELPRIEM